MADCIIATFMDYDEYYHAVILTPAGRYCASSGSLRLLAEASEDCARQATGETFNSRAVEWHWFGLLADTSEAHVCDLLAAPVA